MTSSTLQRINPRGLYNPAPNGYGHVCIVPPGATLVFIAGQGGEDENGSLDKDNFSAQVHQAFANLVTALTASGARPEHVVKLTTLVVDHSEDKLAILAAVLKSIWGDLAPTQTLIPVPRLALDGMLFEVDATVAIPA